MGPIDVEDEEGKDEKEEEEPAPSFEEPSDEDETLQDDKDDKPEGRGELSYFAEAPKSVKASNNGPTGKGWTRVDYIVDSAPSDSTMPVGVLPQHPLMPPRGY